ncbi:MAG TPA: PAS domain S-box protein, partial [Bryobacteraceae bacterium]|nr:PAS domain S-box protein [Bryobacteraceae bacterium]
MLQELKFQFSTAILTVLTVAAAVAAALNFQQIHRFPLPDDGAVWVENHGRVTAARLDPGGAAEFAGIRIHDVLESIQGIRVMDVNDVPRILAGVSAWKQARYLVRRSGVDVPVTITIRAAPRGFGISWQYLVGVVYLGIGFFIYLRRGSAHKARHFYVFCLVSFILSCFHYTGKLNAFDQVIYWGNVVAGWLSPALFLHFCVTFPEARSWYRRWMAPLLYLPGAILLLVHIGFALGLLVTPGTSLIADRDALDRSWIGLWTAYYVLSGVILAVAWRSAEDTVVRQQLKWLRNGVIFGIGPFALVNAIPYVIGWRVSEQMNYAVVTLILVPLTIAYAIVRYRLMDVDVIFRRGYAYTLATLCVLATFYAIVFGVGSMVQKNFKDLGNLGLITVMLIATFLFQPIRNWIQEKLDRYFYRERYDYRRTLIEFARELSSETDPDHMLQSVADRLMQTLSIRHVVFFLADPEKNGWRLRMSMGSSARPLHSPESLDLSFLDWPQRAPYIFFERTRYHLDVVAAGWPAALRNTIADLDLNYYIPCRARGRVTAWLGVSRTETGEFLSSEDVELLQTLTNYVGIAIENAHLYHSLREKVEEYERLKEFSENIVESINVGILAVGLDDRVESWNTEMERLSGIVRADAVGRTLSELLPAPLVEQLHRARGETGIHHLDKFVLDTPRGEATMNIAITPLVSRDMQQIGRLVIFDDITDRAELERRLVQADKLSSIG